MISAALFRLSAGGAWASFARVPCRRAERGDGGSATRCQERSTLQLHTKGTKGIYVEMCSLNEFQVLKYHVLIWDDYILYRVFQTIFIYS